jgi:ribosome-binding protein aMBF1 (putative translation factor)
MIGQSVQNVNANMSNDFHGGDWHYGGMPVWSREQEFNEAFIARVKRLREERGWTAERMAANLGIPAERYRKYEYRTPLPHYLVEPFASLVERDIEYMLTGRSTAPARQRRTGTLG